MKCTNPYVTSAGEAYGCGRCLSCLIKRRRIWAHRILLESTLWPVNCYATLSYENRHLPLSTTSNGISPLPTLHPRDVQLFLKRLRVKYALPLRFFVVGEYGDATQRPHYHAALFNFPTCSRGRTHRKPGSSRPEWHSCCDVCRLVGETWGLGDIDLGVLEPHSAQYVAGYVTKKMTGKNDARLEGRYPEFARMSLRPGIAHGILQSIAGVLVSHGIEPDDILDVPTVLGHGKKQLPLGRYLRRKLRVLIGKDERCPDEVLQALQAEMYPLYAAAKEVTSHPTMAKYRKEVIRNAIIDVNLGLHQSLLAREGLKKRRQL